MFTPAARDTAVSRCVPALASCLGPLKGSAARSSTLAGQHRPAPPNCSQLSPRTLAPAHQQAQLAQLWSRGQPHLQAAPWVLQPPQPYLGEGAWPALAPAPPTCCPEERAGPPPRQRFPSLQSGFLASALSSSEPRAPGGHQEAVSQDLWTRSARPAGDPGGVQEERRPLLAWLQRRCWRPQGLRTHLALPEVQGPALSWAVQSQALQECQAPGEAAGTTRPPGLRGAGRAGAPPPPFPRWAWPRQGPTQRPLWKGGHLALPLLSVHLSPGGCCPCRTRPGSPKGPAAPGRGSGQMLGP